jgi:DNA-binding protein YbaB
MNELMRQAARVQRKIELAKKELEVQEVTTSGVGGKVTVTVTLGRRVAGLKVDPDFYKSESADVLCDAICATVNQGLEEASKKMETELDKMTGGVKVPGLF